MTAGYPTWCRVGRVVLSRNGKLLLGEKKGGRTQLDLGEITFGRVVLGIDDKTLFRCEMTLN